MVLVLPTVGFAEFVEFAGECLANFVVEVLVVEAESINFPSFGCYFEH